MTGGKNEAARKRLAAVMKKAEPPTREQQIQAEVDRLQAMRARSRQQEAELGWLLELQKRDVIKAEMDAGAAELAELRERLTEAKHSLAALEGDRAIVQKAAPSELLAAVEAKQENYNQCAALAAVVDELTRRIAEAKADQRSRTKVYNALTGRIMQLRVHTGIPG